MALTPSAQADTTARSQPDSGIRLDTYVAMVRGHVVGILALSLIGALAGVALAARRPQLYEARSTVAVNPMVRVASSTSPQPTSPVLAVFNNQSLVMQLLTELGSDRSVDGFTAESFLKEHLIVEEIVPGSMLQVRVRLQDAAAAVRLCNRLVALAIELNTRLTADKMLAGQEFLKKQLESSRVDLQDIERRLLGFKTRSQVELRRAEVDALLDARRELVALDVRIAAEKGRLAAATSELAKRNRTVPSSRREPNPFPTIPPPATSSYQPRRDGDPAAPAVPPGETPPSPARPVSSAPAITEWPSERAPETFLSDQRSNVVDPVYEILDYEVASGRVRLAEFESRRSELASTLGLARPPVGKFAELYQLESEQTRLQAEYDLASKAYEGALTRFKQGDSGDAPEGCIQSCRSRRLGHEVVASIVRRRVGSRRLPRTGGRTGCGPPHRRPA